MHHFVQKRSILYCALLLILLGQACSNGNYSSGAINKGNPTVIQTEIIYSSGDCESVKGPEIWYASDEKSARQLISDELEKPSKHFVGKNIGNKKLSNALMAVDYHKYNTLLVSLGAKPTPGYRVTDIVAVEYLSESSHLDLMLRVSSPAKDILLPQVLTAPCVAIQLEKVPMSSVSLKDSNELTAFVSKSFK